MLRFNTFRQQRYLRSRFVEGKYLLASEGSDLELEMVELARMNIMQSLGDSVAINNGWKVEKLNASQILIRTGQGFHKGLPFEFRFGKDQLVSGSILAIGSVPVGVTVADDSNGLGKVVTFNNAATTPTNNYTITITAKEQVITDIEDPFLHNVNITESTAQKVRLVYQLNIVPTSSQTETSTPYRDETGVATSVTNFPNTGGFGSPNLSDRVEVTPTAAGNGELLALNVISGSESIDGRDLELTVRNNPSIGGGNPFPNSPSLQAAFSNGALYDSNGNRFHVNAIFNDTVSTQLIIRLDKEYLQPNPELINTKPYYLVKREVFVTDDTNGTPQGKLNWQIATIDWDEVSGFLHQSSVQDLRKVVVQQEDYQEKTDIKHTLSITNNSTISWSTSTNIVTWAGDFKFVNPSGPDQTITAAAIPLVEDGALVYDLKLDAGGTLEKGTLAINVTSFGTTSSLSAVDLSLVRKGNVVVDSAGFVTYITAIDDVNNTITTNSALTANGSSTIYYDSFGPQYSPLSVDSITLAVRKNNKVYFSGLTLENGEISSLNNTVSTQLLDFIGSTGITDDTPNYSSNIRGIAGESLKDRLETLTDAVGDEQEDRSSYLRSNEEVTWTGTQLEFSANIILERLNTKSGSAAIHNILVANSPIIIGNGESIWVEIDRTQTSENLNVFNSGTTPIPAQTQSDKDVFVLFRRIDFGGTSYLHLPFTKQLITEGQSVRLGASGSGSSAVKATFLDPLSITLPTGASVTIDNVAGVNGDTVLFTNLSSGNNRIYELSGVGTSIVWTAKRSFDGQFDPTDGDSVRIKTGDAFSEQLAVFDGTSFKVNDIVRFFDGISANFWELGSIKTITLLDNTTDNVFIVSVSNNENFVIPYSIVRGSNKETGQLFLTSDGTNASVAKTTSFIGDVGVEFTADVSGSDLRLRYTTTSMATNATIKLFTMRWSDSSGGPSGIPNYSGFSGSSTSAAGVIGDVQYKGSSGNLEGDTYFKWDTSNKLLNLNGLSISALAGPLTILDNQASAQDLLTLTASTNLFLVIEYSITRNTDYSVGRLLVVNNGTSATLTDDNAAIGTVGVIFSAMISAGDLKIQYVSSNTGFNANFKYSVRKWN